jgi:hypothetical protein
LAVFMFASLLGSLVGPSAWRRTRQASSNF